MNYEDFKNKYLNSIMDDSREYERRRAEYEYRKQVERTLDDLRRQMMDRQAQIQGNPYMSDSEKYRDMMRNLSNLQQQTTAAQTALGQALSNPAYAQRSIDPRFYSPLSPKWMPWEEDEEETKRRKEKEDKENKKQVDVINEENKREESRVLEELEM